jgi:hypothetical protein
LEDRVRCYSLLREVGGLAYVLGHAMNEECDDALAKIQELLRRSKVPEIPPREGGVD